MPPRYALSCRKTPCSSADQYSQKPPVSTCTHVAPASSGTSPQTCAVLVLGVRLPSLSVVTTFQVHCVPSASGRNAAPECSLPLAGDCAGSTRTANGTRTAAAARQLASARPRGSG